MASSSSSEKINEKPPAAVTAAADQNTDQNLHVALPSELIDGMKNTEDWGESFQWMYDEEKIDKVEEKIEKVWEIQQNMDLDDLLHYVMYGDGREVVWNDDVWNLQQISKQPPQPQEPKKGKDDNGESPSPSPSLAEEEPDKNGN